MGFHEDDRIRHKNQKWERSQALSLIEKLSTEGFSDEEIATMLLETDLNEFNKNTIELAIVILEQKLMESKDE